MGEKTNPRLNDEHLSLITIDLLTRHHDYKNLLVKLHLGMI